MKDFPISKFFFKHKDQFQQLYGDIKAAGLIDQWGAEIEDLDISKKISYNINRDFKKDFITLNIKSVNLDYSGDSLKKIDEKISFDVYENLKMAIPIHWERHESAGARTILNKLISTNESISLAPNSNTFRSKGVASPQNIEGLMIRKNVMLEELADLRRELSEYKPKISHYSIDQDSSYGQVFTESALGDLSLSRDKHLRKSNSIVLDRFSEGAVRQFIEQNKHIKNVSIFHHSADDDSVQSAVKHFKTEAKVIVNSYDPYYQLGIDTHPAIENLKIQNRRGLEVSRSNLGLDYDI